MRTFETVIEMIQDGIKAITIFVVFMSIFYTIFNFCF